MEIRYTPIGEIHSPYQEPVGVPIQPTAAPEVRATIKVYPEFSAGLKDLEGFSHIILLYHLHRSSTYDLQAVPFLDSVKRGVFSTRAPRRPNPIGMSIVRLLAVEGSMLQIAGVDIINGTPLLDIKPYMPVLNPSGEIRTGWAQEQLPDFFTRQADDRFSREEKDPPGS